MKKSHRLTGMSVLCILMLCLMNGCMIADTPEDECIVRQRSALDQQAKTVASGDGLTIASQVQAEKTYKWNYSDGCVDVLVHADVKMPKKEGFKLWKAIPRMFTQQDVDGWVQTLAQGQKLWMPKPETGEFSLQDVKEWKQQLLRKRDEMQQESLDTYEWEQEMQNIECGIEECDLELESGLLYDDSERRTLEWSLTGSKEEEATEEYEQNANEQEEYEGYGSYAEDTEAMINAGAVMGEKMGNEAYGVAEEDEEDEEGYNQNNLYGYVTIQDEFAPWAKAEEKEYVCNLENTEYPGYTASIFSFRRRYRYGYTPNETGDWNKEAETEVSKKEMRRAADAMVEKLGETGLSFAKALPVYNFGMETALYGSHFLKNSKGWCFFYTRKLDDILVTCEEGVISENMQALYKRFYPDMDAFWKMESEAEQQSSKRQMEWNQEMFYIIFDDEGFVELYWENPCTVERISKENVFLLPFSEIRQVFERSLSVQPVLELFLETWIPVKADITEVRLGYMRYNMPGEKYAEMIPVWDFIGTIKGYEQDSVGDEDDWVSTYLREGEKGSLMTINAMDGTVVDRRRLY